MEEAIREIYDSLPRTRPITIQEELTNDHRLVIIQATQEKIDRLKADKDNLFSKIHDQSPDELEQLRTYLDEISSIEVQIKDYLQSTQDHLKRMYGSEVELDSQARQDLFMAKISKTWTDYRKKVVDQVVNDLYPKLRALTLEDLRDGISSPKFLDEPSKMVEWYYPDLSLIDHKFVKECLQVQNLIVELYNSLASTPGGSKLCRWSNFEFAEFDT